jgi:hypothetical protein
VQATQAASTPSLRAELTLLEHAERAIEQRNSSLALALLRRHRARFVASSFGQERDGLELIAHCMTGSADDHADVVRFLAQSGGATLHDRVRAACLEQP